MQQVADWLQKLGLGQYAQRFAENDIDFSVLRYLTDERRQVTVMFSDLVGSTALSARIDPEDLREVISAYQKCTAEAVVGGFVAKFMGDGVLVYFGYPQAHQDDAERAVHAGLELVKTVSDLKTHAPLQTRVGIATGLVVVGDLIGSGATQEQAIVGETPNLAARLQGCQSVRRCRSRALQLEMQNAARAGRCHLLPLSGPSIWRAYGPAPCCRARSPH
jgi:class 3 adenylate cyclase